MPDGAELTLGHDLVGRETQRQCDAFALRQEYDAMGQLTRAHSGQLQQGHLLAGLAREYRYERAGNLIGERHGREAQGYRLDGCGRVLESLSYRPDTGLSQEAQFGYTRQGQPLGEADATYWQQGRAQQQGDTHYDYDKAGRLISKRQLRAGFRPEQWHYRWDSRNQLCAVTTPNGTTWQYRYDPFGRRISKRCEQTGEEVCYLWDGDQIAEVRHLQRGQLLARRHWIWRGWELLVQQRQTGNAQANASTVDREQGQPWQTDFAISKQNGEVIGLYNQQGELHWKAAKASLWGHLRNSHYVRSIDPSLGFAGQLRDNESGLCYNRFRYYDPQAARYISPDPIGILGGENNYGYVPNPVNWIDPLGLSSHSSSVLNFTDSMGTSLQVNGYTDLSHLSNKELTSLYYANKGSGFGLSPKDKKGNTIVLHHHKQNANGPIVAMPAKHHDKKHTNPGQHPFGKAKGGGLNEAERQHLIIGEKNIMLTWLKLNLINEA